MQRRVFIMAIRQIVVSALAVAAIAGGGVAAAPSAFALPRQCGLLVGVEMSWWDQYLYSNDNYGSTDSRTINALDHFAVAQDRAFAAGCGQ
jgi:hypothetical protein